MVLIRNFIELLSRLNRRAPGRALRPVQMDKLDIATTFRGHLGQLRDISDTVVDTAARARTRFYAELTAGYLDRQRSDPGVYPLGSRQKLVARRMDRPLRSIIGRGFRGSCVTYPAIFLTALLVVDTQTQAQVAPQTLAAPRLTQRGHRRRPWASVSGSSPGSCDRGRLGARAEKSRHSYLRRWFCGRLIPFFCGRLPTRAGRSRHASLGDLVQTPKASLVAAPVRSAAPVRRHPRLISVPDQPECWP